MLAIGKEQFSFIRFGGIAVTVGGCLFMVLGGEHDDTIKHTALEILFGNILLIINLVIIGILYVMQIDTLKRMHVIVLNYYAFLYSAVMFVIACLVRYGMEGSSYFEPLYGEQWIVVWVTILFFGTFEYDDDDDDE